MRSCFIAQTGAQIGAQIRGQIRAASCLAGAALLSACAGHSPPMTATQEAATYVARAKPSYAPPGPPGDPWGPYITEAAAKYDVPERWIREVMRVESGGQEFRSSGVLITSPVGAMGLMQLMPATARRTAAQSGLPDTDLFDPSQNMALGTTYLAGLIQQFGNCLPLAIAAYNAGPNNVANWLALNGDPELGKNPGSADIIDWIEEIPFSETRNYVQRVTESIVIYRAYLTGSANNPLSPWMQSP
jgi:soluble lytic murein transglycosylase